MMKKREVNIQTVPCTVYESSHPAYLLLQPVDDHDLQGLDAEVRYIEEHTCDGFMLVAFKVQDWNDDLSPWEAPAVFGDALFGGKATDTLAFVQDALLPEIKNHYDLQTRTGKPAQLILGGYSLAGLFCLWSAYQTDLFDGIVGVSPSVWFAGWPEYISERIPRASEIYLSLGDREERTRNPQMARVGENIRKQYQLLETQGVKSVLEWNQGNHFREPDIRTAKGFVWAMNAD